MKKLLFLCMSIATLVSCSKDDDGGNGGSAAAKYLLPTRHSFLNVPQNN